MRKRAPEAHSRYLFRRSFICSPAAVLGFIAKLRRDFVQLQLHPDVKQIVQKIALLALILGSFVSQAQEVGVRFGQVSGNNVAVDAVFEAGDWSRIHANVSFGSGLGLDALWDFVDKPLSGEAFTWYAGVGPSAYISNDLFLLGASGEIGLEYHFNTAPIALGLDYRPTFWIVEDTEFEFGGFGLNVRYVF